MRANTEYTLALNHMEPVRLRADTPIAISLGLNFRIRKMDDEPNYFTTSIVTYFYGLATFEGREILTFHWNPVATGVSFPHLHVGRAVVSDATEVLPKTFHKVHVPTGFVPMASVIRLAITEFGVQPLRPNWQSILDEAEEAARQ